MCDLEETYKNKYIQLLFIESNERNKIFNDFSINDIYNLIYLSSGIYGESIRVHSLKLFHKFVLYTQQIYSLNTNCDVNKHILEKLYNYLLTYNYLNKSNKIIMDEINQKIIIIRNYESFRNYITNNNEISNILQSLVDKKK